MIEAIADGLQLVTQVVLAAAVATVLWVLLRARRLLDRVVALEVLSALTVAIAAMVTLVTRVTVTIDIALAVALISFTGTVAFASFVESRREDV